MSTAIGMIELSSIAAGFSVGDAMIKSADVELCISRTICSGKYLLVVGGNIASVKAAVEAGAEAAGGFLIEKLLIPNVDAQVFPALSGVVNLPSDSGQALGVIETFSAVPIFQAADAAVKAADVILFRVHVSMAIGGKGFMLVCGNVASVKAAIDAGVEAVRDTGMLVNRIVVPSISPEMLRDYI